MFEAKQAQCLRCFLASELGNLDQISLQLPSRLDTYENAQEDHG